MFRFPYDPASPCRALRPTLVALAVAALSVGTSAWARNDAPEPGADAAKRTNAKRSAERRGVVIDPTARLRTAAEAPAVAAAPAAPGRDRAPAAAPTPAAAPSPVSMPAPPPPPPPPPPAPAPAVTAVRVPYIPESLRKELKEEIRRDLVAQAREEGWAPPDGVPSWVRGMRIDGDLRLRYQFDRFADGNAPAVNVSETNRTRALTLLNTTQSRSRLRVRARLGIAYDLDERWTTQLRLGTGNATDPVSSNQTLGTYNNKFTAVIDRANLRYRPLDGLQLIGGRIGNPWFGTDLVWANDLGFDGIAAQWTPRFSPTWRGFATLAALSVQEVELSSKDKWLLGLQLGAEGTDMFAGLNGKFGLGFYRYRNVVGVASDPGSTLNEFTAAQSAQKGNTYFNISSDATRPLLGLASDYHLVNLTGTIEWPLAGGRHVLLTADHVRNGGFDRAAVAARVGTDVEPRTSGTLLRLAFGQAEVKRAHDWQIFGAYKRVERDAVLDAFTDSDFRLGGTDAKGYIVGGSYGLGRNAVASLRVLSGDSISGAPLSVDVVQFDVLVRY